MDSSRLSLLSLVLLSCVFLTRAAPPPWSVQDPSTKEVCIVTSFNATFAVPYNSTKGWSLATFSLGAGTDVASKRSYCSSPTTKNTQSITLTWDLLYMYNLTIVFTKPSDTSFFVNQVLFEYDVRDPKNFPNANTTLNQTVTSEVNLLSVPMGYAYECWTGVAVGLNKTGPYPAVSVSDLRIEAFRTGRNDSWYDPVLHCDSDTTTTVTTTPTTTTTTETTTSTSTTTTETTTSTSTSTTTTETSTSTTMLPPGPKAQWTVTDTVTGNQCVLANFTGKFLIAYDAMNPANQTQTTNSSLMIPATGVMVDKDASTCRGYTLGSYNQLKLKWMNGAYPYALTLVFNMTNANVTSVSRVYLEYSLNDTKTFPNATEGKSWYRIAEYNGVAPVATINRDMYMKCDSGVPVMGMVETIDKKAVSGELYDVKLEAFRMSKTDTFDDKESICPGDEVTTTPYPISTTTPAHISVANYTVLHNGMPCLTALFSMDLAVVWRNVNNSAYNSSWPNLNNATVDEKRSMCDNETALLVIQDFLPSWSLWFNFTHTKDHFALTNITLIFNLTNDNFPHANFSSTQVSHTDGLNALSTTLGRHYMCKVPTRWQLSTEHTQGVNEIDLLLEQVQVEAFMTDGQWGPVEECSADNGGGGDTSEIVPIAVGCALAALVIIVLIAYVIGRRRNRARGYETM